jgi:hypothetical protein
MKGWLGIVGMGVCVGLTTRVAVGGVAADTTGNDVVASMGVAAGDVFTSLFALLFGTRRRKEVVAGGESVGKVGGIVDTNVEGCTPGGILILIFPFEGFA